MGRDLPGFPWGGIAPPPSPFPAEPEVADAAEELMGKSAAASWSKA